MTAPRLVACGGNINHVIEIQGVTQQGRRNTFSMQDDLGEIRRWLVAARDEGFELISEGFDMAIRVGELEDSSLRARKLTETSKRMIGAPGYFQKFGRPQKIDDLNDHKLLHYSNQANGNVWKMTAPSGEKRQVRSVGWLTVNDGQSLLNAAISGLGIAYLPSFLYADAMRQGLVEEAIPGLPVEVLGIYAVYPPGRFTQPKVRAFIDFLARRYTDKGPDNW